MAAPGSPLFVTEFGRGKPMLCLHGIEAYGLRYLALATRLDGVRIVAPDLRGHGRSPRSGPFSLAQHVADLLPILSELGPQTTVVGHSFGGLIAWELARAAPDAVASLVLIDPALHVRPAFAQQCLDESGIHLRWPDHQAVFRELTAGQPPAVHWLAALDTAVGFEQTAEGVIRVAVTDDAVTACWAALQQPVSESSFRGPTLLLEAGQENGAYCSPTAVASLRRQLGGRLTHEVFDLGHSIPTDGPDLLADSIRDLLRPTVA